MISAKLKMDKMKWVNTLARFSPSSLGTTSFLSSSSHKISSRLVPRCRTGIHRFYSTSPSQSSIFSSKSYNSIRSFSTTAAATSTFSRRTAFALFGAAGLGMGYYGLVIHPRIVAPDAELVVTEIEAPQPFEHPFDDLPWFARNFYKTKRFLYLCFVFAPCIAVSVIAKVTESEYWRKYWLRLLVETIETAGCSFQKFGQWLSMRPDLFPADVIEALAKLRDEVPPHDFSHTQRMIRESFGAEVEEMFEIFDEKPIASGTVGQVHHARLRPEYARQANIKTPTGELVSEVAVKIRHPHVLDETWLDVHIIFSIIDKSRMLTIPFSKADFTGNLQKQIDFKWEAHNLTRFAKNFKEEMLAGKVSFPTVSPELLSGCVLVESWASGEAVSSILSDVGYGFQGIKEQSEKVLQQFSDAIMKQKRELAKTMFDVNMKMFLRDNLVHGDLHAGNVMFDKDGHCTVIDAGLTTSLDPSVQTSFGKFLHALCTGNSVEMVRRLQEFDQKHCVGEVGSEAHIAFTEDITEVVNTWVSPNGNATSPDGGPISLGDIIGGLLFTLQRHGVQLRGDVASCLMTMSISEGLIRSLDPDFDVAVAALPYFVRFNGWSSTKAVLRGY